jgi:2-polyprenyl-3-methyl-5-hydroxy-6-metoxy-1,4-benzoquinol methylase
MLLKTDWNKYLHNIRETEIKKVFDHYGNRLFSKGLEIGCGDGYQTTFLSKHCEQFISGDLNFNRIKETLKVPSVIYKQFDADNLKGIFSPQEFDFIFSSNVIEHLSDPKGFLDNVHVYLEDNGFMVCIIPSRLVKVSYLLLHCVNLFVLIVDRLIGLFQGKKIFRGENIKNENNINILKNKSLSKNKFGKIFFPQIHGNFKSHTEEFIKFGKSRWEALFKETGYNVERYIKGSAFSGYGFGWDRLRLVLEYLGWSSEHVFILKKKN